MTSRHACRSTLLAKTAATALAATLALGTTLVNAQEKYPSRPVEMVVTFGPGGGADSMGRKMSQLLEKQLGVPFPVSNVGGASGNAGLTKVLTSAPDGYTAGTLIALTVSAWASGLGTAKPEDFAIVAVTQDSPSMMFVPADSPFKTFKDMLDFAKANPGKLKIATSGYGTQDDITIKYFESKGYKMTNVPFAKPAERYASPIGKHTDAIYEEPGDVAPFLAAGQLRPLVVFDDERHPAFKDAPTSKELGFQISDLPNFRTIAVSAKTPPERIKVLADAVNVALDSAEWKKFCADTYTCASRRYTPAEAQVYVKAFQDKVKGYLATFK
ncbi:MAG: tripartite tricarboxylate transporter substrate binding protein [Rhizobacter sp.]|nr:tripartite tricarboxylate transporter substrate binding protein [Rhizobacter sp.]